MLPYFPRPYPDELLYSLLARYHRHTCSMSPKHTIEDLFGSRQVRASVALPGHLGALAQHLPPEWGLTGERMALELTLFPYFVAFQRPGVDRSVLTAMIDGSTVGIHMRLGVTASAVRAPAMLQFCPLCHGEAVARWGEAYWHRVHQLPGVLVCPEHKVPVLASSVSVTPDQQHEFIPATDETCRFAEVPSAISDACPALLSDIALRSVRLLESLPVRRDPMVLATCYRQALHERGLASPEGRVDQNQLHEKFGLALSSVSAALPQVADPGWLTSIVRAHRHAFHPLCHVLFELFLDLQSPARTDRAGACRDAAWHDRRLRPFAPEFESRLRDLVHGGLGLRACAHALDVDPKTVVRHAERLGIPTRWRTQFRLRNPEKESPRAAIRQHWLAIQGDAPALGRKALAARLPAEHAWLYRNDREWLDANSPAAKPRSPRAARRDWNAIDRKLAAEIRRVAVVILSLSPPVRVSQAELERRLDQRGWIDKRRGKLPRTVAAVKAVAESIEVFRIRRISWARAVLERTSRPAPVWKIRRLAGIPSRAPGAVESALLSPDRKNCRSVPCR